MSMTTVTILIGVVVILLAVMAVIVLAGVVVIIRGQVTKRRSTSQRRPAGRIAHPSGPVVPQQVNQTPRAWCPNCASARVFVHGIDPVGNPCYECRDCGWKDLTGYGTYDLLIPLPPNHEDRCPRCGFLNFGHQTGPQWLSARICGKCGESSARNQDSQVQRRESPADPWDVILGRWQNPFGDGTVYETVRSPSEKYAYETRIAEIGPMFAGHRTVGEVVGLVNPSQEPGTYHGVGKWLNPMTGESGTRQAAIRMIDKDTYEDSGVQYKRVQ